MTPDWPHREPVLSRTLDLLADVLEDTVLLYGTPPPAGRDLDLLVRPNEERAAVEALEGAGFLRRRDSWALVRPGGLVVDLTPVRRWSLPEDQVTDLFAAATGVLAGGRLARPAPHHELLILSRRTARRGGRLDAGTRTRVRAALAEDAAAAWEAAGARAGAWAAEEALRLLRDSFDGKPVSPALVRAANVRLERATGKGRLRARAAAVRRFRTRPAPAPLVTLSGVDGSGKSTLARNTTALLEDLGHDAEPVWSSVKHQSAADRLAAAVRRVRRRRPGIAAPPPLRVPRELRAGDVGTRPSAAVHAWTLLLAATDAVHNARSTRSVRSAGTTVVRDRYVLDTAAQLRYLYGGHPFRLQTWLSRRLSPRPTFAYFLDIEAAEALRRKPEEYSLEQMQRLVGLYRAENARVAAERMDTDLPPLALATQVARDVWLAG